MDIKKITTGYEQKILHLLGRVDINHIVCTSFEIDDRGDLTYKEVQAYLDSNKYHKIPVTSVMLFNVPPDNDITTQDKENEQLKEIVNDLLRNLDKELKEVCKHGEFAYEMNDLFKSAIKAIDLHMNRMSYQQWLKDHDTRNDDRFYSVLIGKMRYPFRLINLDPTPLCNIEIERQFNFRRTLLQTVKNIIINLFSAHLFLPDLSLEPRIIYACNKSELFEVIYALSLKGTFKDTGAATAILIELFDLDNHEYSQFISELRNKRKDKSIYLKKLVDTLDNISSGKKEPDNPSLNKRGRKPKSKASK